MKKLLLLLLCVPLIFSCGEDNDKKKEKEKDIEGYERINKRPSKEDLDKGAMLDEGSKAKGESITEKKHYDEDGNMTEWARYNTNGELYGKYKYQYDEDGNMTEKIQYDEDGEISKKNEYQYDEYGNITEEAHYNADGELIGRFISQYQGTQTSPNGDKYVGEIKEGLRHGQGTMTYADGTVEKGLWENDIFIGE